MLKRPLLIAAVVALLPARAPAQSTATLMGVDVYRSEALAAGQIKSEAGGLLKTYLSLRNSGRSSVLKRADVIKAEIEAKISKLGDFAYVRLHYGEYYTSAQHSAYVTVDVVDAKDAARRMNFTPRPLGHVKDPEGLLAAWRRYSDLGASLVKQGLISTERPDCAALYCLWGSETPELAALERKFSSAVPPDRNLLLGVLSQEADTAKRAAAVTLLSYLPPGREALDVMFDALHDPDDAVRSAALQVLSDIAVYHKDLFVDVKKIIPLIDDPWTTNRSRALGILVAMSDDPSNRPALMEGAVPRLLPLLKLEQPSNHELAFTLLGLLSSEPYGPKDYDAWERWIADPNAPEKKSGKH